MTDDTVIDIDEARKTRDWKQTLQSGPVWFRRLSIISTDEISRSKVDRIKYEKKYMAHDLAMFLLEENILRFYMEPHDFGKGKSGVRLEMVISVFVGKKTKANME